MTVFDPQHAPRVNTPEIALPPRPHPVTPAHIIKEEAEAIDIAHELAEEFGKDAALRDREGFLPVNELDRFSQSGLWGITVPQAYGGAQLSYVTVAEVIKIISAVDPSIGQIPHNHLAIVENIALEGSEEQKRFFFGEVLRGLRLGNAMAEAGSRTVLEIQTKIVADGDDYIVNGKKFYSTGALLSHYVAIVAKNEQGLPCFAFVDRAEPGLTIINDWACFGQRTTASGTVLIDNIKVPASRVMRARWSGLPPTPGGPINQIITGAIDLGIAKGAIAELIDFVRTKTRPWIDSGANAASEEPFTIAAVGDLEIRLHAAEAITERAGRLIDRALAEPSEAAVAEASIATAEAKVLSTEISLLATNKLFELAGTRATLNSYALDRHWRNARTHTLHDPVRWKYFHVGNYYLNGVNPPSSAYL
jgi:SfnB family sulfur acquisition oxidoreductase